jgi:hypothetical protein
MVHIWIDRKPVLTETLANTPMSSYLIREQHFFCLATRNARIMVVQLGIKNGIFHPLSGKDKKLDGINFIISCADIPCRVYRCHCQYVLRKQNVLTGEYCLVLRYLLALARSESSVHIIATAVTNPTYRWGSTKCVMWCHWKTDDWFRHFYP